MPRNLGKILGGGLGWAFGGPLGAILGVIFGSVMDSAGDGGTAYLGNGDSGQGYSHDDFFMSLLVLSAAVMKADGKQLKSELSYIKAFLVGNFGEERTKAALPTLKKLLNTEISVRQVCLQINTHVNHAGRLQLMHYLYGIAAADDRIDPEEERLLQQIAGYFRVSAADQAAIRAMFVKNVNWAYEVLEVEESVSDEGVKKAYRRMAVRFHPDKVSSLGEDAVNAAQEKFKKVQEAYEEIKKQRGIK